MWKGVVGHTFVICEGRLKSSWTGGNVLLLYRGRGDCYSKL